jgi:hypothetical protein
MKDQIFLKLSILVLILLSIYSCEKDKPVNYVDLLTNSSSKVWYLKRTVPDLYNAELPACLADDEHKFMSDGKYLLDHMGTFLTDDMGEVFCSEETNFISAFSWNFNLTMDTITFITPPFTSSGKVQKLTVDSLIIKYGGNGSQIHTNYYVAKK